MHRSMFVKSGFKVKGLKLFEWMYVLLKSLKWNKYPKYLFWIGISKCFSYSEMFYFFNYFLLLWAYSSKLPNGASSTSMATIFMLGRKRLTISLKYVSIRCLYNHRYLNFLILCLFFSFRYIHEKTWIYGSIYIAILINFGNVKSVCQMFDEMSERDKKKTFVTYFLCCDFSNLSTMSWKFTVIW